MKRIFPLLFALHVLCGLNTYAVTRYSIANGNWNAAGTWSNSSGGASCGCTPSNTDDVVIEGGYTVTLTANAIINSISITQNSSLTHNNGINLDITGTADVTGHTSNGTTSWNINGGSAVVAGTTTITGGSNNSRLAKIILSTGTLDMNGDLVFVTGNDQRAELDMSGGACTVYLAGQLTVNTRGTVTPGSSSTFIYDGTGAQNVAGRNAMSFYNLTIDKSSGTATSASAVVVGGALNIQAGTFDPADQNLTVSGATSVAGTFLVSSGSPGTLSFADITITGTWNNSGNGAVSCSGNITSNGGTFSSGTGTHTLSGSSKSIGGTSANLTFSGAVSISGSYTNNLSGALTITGNLSGAGSLTNPANNTIYLGGDASISTLTATANGNTVYYNASGTQSIKESTTYYHLIIASGAFARATTSGAVTDIDGDLHIYGELDFNGNPGPTINVAGNMYMYTGSKINSDNGGRSNFTVTNNFYAQSGNITLGQFQSLTISGTVYAATSTTLNFTDNTGSVSIGNIDMASGSVWTSDATVAYSVSGDLDMTAATINGSATGVFTIGGNFTVNIGTSTLDRLTLTVNGNTQVDGRLDFTSTTGTKTFNGTVTVSNTGNWNNSASSAITLGSDLTVDGGTFTSGTGTYTLSGNSKSIGGTSPGLTFSGAVSIGGSYENNINTLTIGGVCSGAGSLTNAANKTIYFNDNVTITSLDATSGGNTIYYNKSGTQTFRHGSTYHDLVISSGTIATDAGGTNTTTINGDMTINGELDVSANSPTYNIAGSLTMNNGSKLNVTTANNLFFMNITTDFSINGSVAIGRFSGITVNGNTTLAASATLQFTDGAGADATSFNNVYLLSGSTWESDANAGTMTYNINGTLSMTGATLIGNNRNNFVINNLTLNNGTNTIANQTVSISGTTQIDGQLDLTSTTGAKTFHHTTVSSTGNWNNSANVDVTFSGDLTVDGGTFSSGTGTYTFTGTGVQISGTSASLTFAGTLSISGTCTNNINTLVVGGVCSGAGTLTNAANKTIQFASDVTISSLVATANDNTIEYTGSGAQAPAFTTYYNLKQSGSGTVSHTGSTITVNNSFVKTASSGTWDMSAAGSHMTGTGNVDMSGGTWQIFSNITSSPGLPEMTGTYSLTGGTIDFDRSGNQTIRGGISYHNVTFSNSNTKTLDGNIIVNGDLTIDNSARLDVKSGSNYSIDILGNWINNSSNGTPFDARSGTVTLRGSTPQSIGGSSSTTFYDLTADNANDVSLGVSTGVDHTLTLSNGKISIGNYDLTIGTSSSTTASITGYSSSKYIVTGGTGYLRQENIGTSGRTGNIIFPVGASTASYNPVTLSNTGTKDRFDVKICNYINTSGGCSGGSPYASSVVNRTWDIEEGTAGGSSVDLTLQWEAADELASFDRANCYISHHDGAEWGATQAITAASGSGPYILSSTGLSSFSPHGVGSLGLLPIELLAFTAEAKSNAVLLRWHTASETNNDYFAIERSTDGVNFTEVTRVKGAGNSHEKLSYAARDENPLKGVSYYRLKQTDFDGKFTYSQLVPVAIDAYTSEEIKIFPNPVPRGQTPFITLPGDEEKEILVVLNDISGKEVYSKVIITSKSAENTVAISPSRMLASGIYFIVASSNNEVYRQKLIIR